MELTTGLKALELLEQLLDAKCKMNNLSLKLFQVIHSNPGNPLLILCNKYIYDSKKVRGSCGVGLVWYSPIGLIKLDYGIPFKKELFDNVSKVRFSMGKSF